MDLGFYYTPAAFIHFNKFQVFHCCFCKKVAFYPKTIFDTLFGYLIDIDSIYNDNSDLFYSEHPYFLTPQEQELPCHIQ